MTAVVIVGGGPTGLTAAAALAPSTEVIVLERESATGGIPRHSDHTGYGLRDLHRVLTGPAYARRLSELARTAGADLRTNSMATGWAPDGRLEVTSPQGRYTLSAKAILLATGARERPRAARLVPGDRGAGVYTTGALQNLVHLQHRSPGTRAVVIGAELVSWSAALTLREAGCQVISLVTEHERPESYAAFNLAGRAALRIPVATRTRVISIIGRPRVTGVEVEDRDGLRRIIECDTVVFTGDWIPDNELARSAGLDLDPSTRGPLVDTADQTSRAGVFAAGNLVHPVVTADFAALAGRRAARQVTHWLDGERSDVAMVNLIAQAPFRWVTPGRWAPGTSDRRLVLWTDRWVPVPQVRAWQGDREIGRIRTPWPAAPGRAFQLPGSLLRQAVPDAGPITIGLG